MKTWKIASLCSLALLVSACSSISVSPNPEKVSLGEVCITPDASNRKVAYNATINALNNKGFRVKEISMAQAGQCPRLITCQSLSRWDLANFTSQIAYEWIEDGQIKAKANYRATNGLNFTKFINTQEMVNHLLNQMLPSTPVLPSRYVGK